jgi:protein ImuA
MRVVPALMRDHAMLPEITRWPSGIASFDTVLGGGVAYGRVHEIYTAETGDAAAAAGFAVALATAMAKDGRTSFWLRSRCDVEQSGAIQANGWAELGGKPEAVVAGVFTDVATLLRAAVNALHCTAPGAVIIESRGQVRELDLTASRRLALAAEKSGVPLFLLRIDAIPAPSAAQTRWQVAAAPSQALPGNAPGKPTFDIELLRQKSGPSGMRWRLEWDRDQCTFHEVQSGKAALSGTVVSVPARRSAADTGSAPRSRRAA